MGKRKLRNCAKCGRSHGLPTGKNCSRSLEDFTVKTEIEEDHSVVMSPGGNDAGKEGPMKDDERESIATGFSKDKPAGKKIFAPWA